MLSGVAGAATACMTGHKETTKMKRKVCFVRCGFFVSADYVGGEAQTGVLVAVVMPLHPIEYRCPKYKRQMTTVHKIYGLRCQRAGCFDWSGRIPDHTDLIPVIAALLRMEFSFGCTAFANRLGLPIRLDSIVSALSILSSIVGRPLRLRDASSLVSSSNNTLILLYFS